MEEIKGVEHLTHLKMDLNSNKEIYFKNEARQLLFSGVEKLSQAVASTMGPNGRTVIISNEYGDPEITKDGVKVAREINFKNAIENIGAKIVKEVAELQVDLAGDGTTTAIVLANAFIQNLKSFDSKEINKAFDEIIPKVLEQLKLKSKKLAQKDIKYLASISANNDTNIGDIIQQAYNHASIIKVEESNENKDSLELIDGMSLPVSYFSKHFINTIKKAECNLEEPFVLLIDGKLENLKSFETAIKAIAEDNDSLLIITESISENLLRLLESNVLNGSLKLCVIKSPGFSQHRKDLLNDISDFTGACLINDFTKQHDITSFGRLKSLKVAKNNSILVKHPDVDIKEYIEDLIDLSKLKELSKQDKELVDQRISNLTGKVSIIKVGGVSEIEMKERKDRYDDAVLATACALEEGIVQGGGLALYHANQITAKSIKSLKHNTVELAILSSLNEPSNIINVPVLTDMFKENIIDPLKVTRCALENAVSVAKTILSTDVVVLNERQWT